MNTQHAIHSHDRNLSEARVRAKKICAQLNATPLAHAKARRAFYRDLFGEVGSAYIEPNFFCDYGYNIFIGDGFYANHNCIILDAAKVSIGERVMLGPNVQIYTANHPLDPEQRATGLEYVAEVRIGNDCWIGGGAIIMPGVSIGDRSVIGAGSVVTRDIPEGVVAVGNPAAVIKTIESPKN